MRLQEIKEDKEYINIVLDILNSDIFKSEDNYIQHGRTTCMEHSIYVSYLAYNICKSRGYDYIAAARAGLLHDMFLYDWHKNDDGRKGLHGFTHPRLAANNAKKYFDISDKEYNMIITHMWPLTPRLPKSKEAWAVTYADKLCSAIEIKDGIASLFRSVCIPN